MSKIFSIAETASKPAKRKLFNEMMAYIQEQGIKVLVVEKVDRLVRSLQDTVRMNTWLEEDPKRQIHSIKDGLILHKASKSQEKLRWNLTVVLAANHIDNMIEEIEKGMMRKLEEGGLPGHHPVGYRSEGPGGRKQVVIDEVMGPKVVEMFNRYLEPTSSLSSLAEDMKSLGLRTSSGRPVVRSRIALMLKNEFYLGKIPWKGKLWEGNHSPLIDPATFRAVQMKLAGRRPVQKHKHDYLFRGMIRCDECKSSVSWSLHKGRVYGRCESRKPCSRKSYAREDRLEEQLARGLESVRQPFPDVAHWVAETLRMNLAKDESSVKAARQALERRHDDLERRLAIAYEDRLDGRISVSRYDDLCASYRDEQAEIQAKLNGDGKAGVELDLLRIDMLEICQHIAELYRHGDKKERREIIGLFFLNFRLEGSILAYSWSNLAYGFVRIARILRKLNKRLELDDFGSAKRKEALMRASRPLWWSMRSESGTGEALARQDAEKIERLIRLIGDGRDPGL